MGIKVGQKYKVKASSERDYREPVLTVISVDEVNETFKFKEGSVEYIYGLIEDHYYLTEEL